MKANNAVKSALIRPCKQNLITRLSICRKKIPKQNMPPRIDPNQLLKCLSVLLSPSGGIKSQDQVQRIASLMTKFSKKLVSKCIYVLILKQTDIDLLDMFMSAGGWDLTFNWLSDAIEVKNWPLVTELVELLLLCPVDLERLQGNNCPKLIKMVTKDYTATENIRSLARQVVDKWLAIVKGSCDASVVQQVQQQAAKPIEPVIQNQSCPVPTSGVAIAQSVPQASNAVESMDVQENGASVASEKPASCEVMESQAIVSVDDDSDDEIRVRRKRSKGSSRGDGDDDDDDEDFEPPTKKYDSKKSLSLKKKSLKKPEEESNKSKSRDKDRDRDRKRSSSDKRPLSKSDDRKKLSDKERMERDKLAKEKRDQEEKDKAVLSKLLTPSIANVGKIPKKSSKDVKSDKNSDDTKKIPHPTKESKKYNISIETRKGGEERPKTVKVFHSKLRSTGLEEPPPLPRNVKKGGDKKEDEKKSLKRSSPSKEVTSMSSPQHHGSKDVHHLHQHSPISEKKIKEDKEEKKEEKDKPTDKLAAAQSKPKLAGLQESDVFADALLAANPVVKDVKKKKRRLSNTSSSSSGSGSSPSSGGTTPTATSSGSGDKTKDKDKDSLKPEASVKPVFKFYQETLTNEDKKEDKEPSGRSEDDDESDLQLSKEEIEEEVAKAEEAIDEARKQEEKKNLERERNRLPKGVLNYVKRCKKSAKSVQWKSDAELESVRYFELDETERVNVAKTFTDMKQMERSNERMLFRKISGDDRMQEQTSWRTPSLVDVEGDLLAPGKKSKEKDIQHARERTTLQAIYFNKSMIPDSPSEPDLEIHAATDPTIIPLEDKTGNADSVITYKDKPWPEPKGFNPEDEPTPIVGGPIGGGPMVVGHPPFALAPGGHMGMGGVGMMGMSPGVMGPGGMMGGGPTSVEMTGMGQQDGGMMMGPGGGPGFPGPAGPFAPGPFGMGPAGMMPGSDWMNGDNNMMVTGGGNNSGGDTMGMMGGPHGGPMNHPAMGPQMHTGGGMMGGVGPPMGSGPPDGMFGPPGGGGGAVPQSGPPQEFMQYPPPLFPQGGGPQGFAPPNGPMNNGPLRPWFRGNQGGGGGGDGGGGGGERGGGGGGGGGGRGGGGGTWRHPNKGNWNNKPRGLCNNYLKRGYCRVPKCQFRHPNNNSNR